MSGAAFHASNNRIWVTNTAGEVVFDTDRKMPAVVAVVEGSMVFPERFPDANQTIVRHYIAGPFPVNPEFVFATGVITGGSDYPWQETTFNASGSIITNLAWNTLDNVNWRLAGCRTITFVSEDKHLYVDEEYYNKLAAQPLQDFTLTYKVYLGAFA